MELMPTNDPVDILLPDANGMPKVFKDCVGRLETLKNATYS